MLVRFRSCKAAMGVRFPPGALAVGIIVKRISAHDVAAAYCLAMAEVRVRLPLGALDFRVWGSLANPRVLEARDRWFKSSHPDFVKEKDQINAVVLVLVRVGDC